jgi:hypothetical protein
MKARIIAGLRRDAKRAHFAAKARGARGSTETNG